MAVSKSISEALNRGSFIRKMFEEGRRLKQEHGAENVFDFSLGNPDVPPPAEFQSVLSEEAARTDPMIHGYMPNAGFEETRAAVAASYAADAGLPFKSENIVVTSGAGGALNIVLKALLDPGDEVVVFAPFFVEYGFYIGNHAGGAARMVVLQTDHRFLPVPETFSEALSERTKAVIINSPNNPTGALYPAETLATMGSILAQHSRKIGRPVYLISDEPYREIVFDGLTYPSPLEHYDHTLVATSSSKALSLPGERIGHVAISPSAAEREALEDAITFCNRTLGFVNAGALMQRVVARLQGVTVDVGIYERRRNVLCAALSEMGFEFVRPGGAFYLFPRSPMDNDGDFADFMRKYRVIVVPGSGFYGQGHFRICFAVPDSTIDKSLEFFGKAARELGLS